MLATEGHKVYRPAHKEVVRMNLSSLQTGGDRRTLLKDRSKGWDGLGRSFLLTEEFRGLERGGFTDDVV